MTGLTPPRGTRDEVQKWMVDRTLEDYEGGHGRLLGVAATGTGKTRTAMKLAARWLDEVDSRPVAWWTHLDHLIDQSSKAMREFGFTVGVEQGRSHVYPLLRGQKSMFGSLDIAILSVKSMKEDRLRCFRPDDFGLHIVDEAHGASAETWSKPMSYFEPLLWKGLTATPITSSGEPLYGDPAAPFRKVAYRYDIRTAVSYGHLAPIRSYVHDLGIDLKGISTRGKQDVPVEELEHRILAKLATIVNKVASEIRRLKVRKVIAFLPTVRSAVLFADALSSPEIGVEAHAVYGKQSKNVSPQARAPYLSDVEREDLIKRHQAFEYPVLANSQYLEIGYDDPSIDMVVMLAATNSVVKIFQRLGRGTRLSPETGKEFLHLFAVSWGSDEIVSSIDMLLVDEPDPQVRKKARELSEKRRFQGKTLEEIVDAAREEVQVEREALEEEEAIRELERDVRRSRHKVRAQEVHCRTTVTEPFGFGEYFGVDLGDGSTSLATLEQRTRLNKHGFKGIAHLSTVDADKILTAYESHLSRGGATLKQQDWVRRSVKMSEEDIKKLTKQDVKNMMMKRCSWGRR